ncbi:MAG: hypothetical protein ACYDHH_09385 [Solirubrobacteraceae bacterium]
MLEVVMDKQDTTHKQDTTREQSEESRRKELADLEVREESDKIRGGLISSDPDEGGQITRR